ncbi:hypothetical protein E3E31_06080 [Thermococcus sp. M39]|uniref:hypothetical protein n=1 Tax=unclassified Thermococcus TaxID=2627626 RepID=UPI00143B35DC|nr:MULTISPECIES: hypothetical protein [unclassified Thermococcus]NJE08092.1 hypothetical protein [Thermococcus sp. M39]NJE11585.1 hypothetical protein [Thermococcus sp. LS2]
MVVIQSQVGNQLFQTAFKWIQLHSDTARIIVLAVLLIAFLLLVYNLFKESSEAFVLYLLVISMTILWFFNSNEFVIKPVFWDSFSFELVYLTLLLLLSCFIFYLAPKLSRELGFLIYGLAFASPTFREAVKTFDKNFFVLFFFVATLALIMNLSYTPKTFRAVLDTFLLSIFTVISIELNFYASAIPLAFIIAFPKRNKRNYVYIGLTLIGIVVLSEIFGTSISTKLFDKSCLYVLTRFIKESFIQLVLILYLFATNFKVAIRMRGQVLFLLILTLMYLPLLTVHPMLFAPLIVVSSALSIRLTQKLYIIAQT